VLGNKREQMAQYGGAVTPPVSRLLNGRLAEVLGGGFTFKDLFCGAGGTSDGAREAGGQLVLGLNHWRRAIESHSANFPDAEHDCADISALTTSQIRRYPDSDVLLASPECTNHSIAKGGRRRKPQAASLFDDGPGGDDEQDRSRATMWDVVRFTEQKMLKGKPYRALIVENVVDAYKWGANDDGDAVRRLADGDDEPRLRVRDRLPELDVRAADAAVARPHVRRLLAEGHHAAEPARRADRVVPVVRERRPRPSGVEEAREPVGTLRRAVRLPLPRLREDLHPRRVPGGVRDRLLDRSAEDRRPREAARERDLRADPSRAAAARRRAVRDPAAARGEPEAAHVPIVSLTRRMDMAMVIPIAGNLGERTPGNRARDAVTDPMATVCAEERPGSRALVTPEQTPLERLAARELGIVELQNHGTVEDGETTPTHTVRSGGFHHALVMRNNGSKVASGWESTPTCEPIRAVTTRPGQALVIPYGSEGHDAIHAAKTITTRDRLALLIPPMGDVIPRVAQLVPAPTQTTTTRAGVIEVAA
jgi:DNA (cytosine-5)-methyltransferase 1